MWSDPLLVQGRRAHLSVFADPVSEASSTGRCVLPPTRLLHMAEFKEWIDLLSSLATLIGIPVAIFVFVQERNRERRARTLEAYLEASNHYNAFLDRVFDNPDLDCGEFLSDDPDVAASGFTVQKLTLFTQLILALERAWFVYEIHGMAKRSRRDDLHGVWRTWLVAFDFWAGRKDFQEAWKVIEPNTPTAFSRHMEGRIRYFQERERSRT